MVAERAADHLDITSDTIQAGEYLLGRACSVHKAYLDEETGLGPSHE